MSKKEANFAKHSRNDETTMSILTEYNRLRKNPSTIKKEVRYKGTLRKKLPLIVSHFINSPHLRCTSDSGCYYSRDGLVKGQSEIYRMDLTPEQLEELRTVNPGVKGCAVGMFLSDRQQRLADDEERDSDQLIEEFGDRKFPDGSYMVPQVVNLNPDLMYALQVWHDTDSYWDEDGMREGAIDSLLRIIVIYGLDYLFEAIPVKYENKILNRLKSLVGVTYTIR